MAANKVCESKYGSFEGADGFWEAGRGGVAGHAAKGAGAAVATYAGVAAEMQAIVRAAAQPAVAGESVKAAIGRAARRLRLGYGRTRSHWYGLARLVSAEEADRLRELRLTLALDRLEQMERERASLRQWVETMSARIEDHRVGAGGTDGPRGEPRGAAGSALAVQLGDVPVQDVAQPGKPHPDTNHAGRRSSGQA